MSPNPTTQPAPAAAPSLRALLAQTAPELHAALERSWKVALEEWLPAVPPSHDSFNSYPHLRNVEAHLSKVVADVDSVLRSSPSVDLRPAEVYILLASILFHDFGRAVRVEQPKHPVLSARGIVKHYGILGIPSLELARCIAAISLAHDPPPTWAPTALYDVVIDPYGEIRQRFLRALLFLGDHMDASYMRARLHYTETPTGLETVGLFRRSVRGVYADCEAQAVRVVLSDMMPWDTSEVAPDSTPVALQNHATQFTTRYTFLNKQSADDLTGLEHPQEFTRAIQAHCPPSAPLALWQFLQSQSTPIPPWFPLDFSRLLDKLSVSDWMVALGCLQVRLEPASPLADPIDQYPWPHRALLATLMHDVGKNHRELSSIRNDLAAAKIYLRAWLLDHREHLYTRFGLETYEPILTAPLLERIAESMWRLSLSIFGCSRFTYAELASEAREPNLPLVRRAVRRLAIIERCELWQGLIDHQQEDADGADMLWAGVAHWRWSKRNGHHPQCRQCKSNSPCWRKELRETSSTQDEPGLYYLKELIQHLQSPLI